MTSAVTDIFQRILDANVVEEAVTATIKKWINTYLHELKLQRSRDTVLPVPRSYNTRPDLVTFSEDQLPAIVVVSPGTVGTPRMAGDGQIEADFSVGVLIVLSAPDAVHLNANVKQYAAAVRAILLQKRSLGGLAISATWDGESYDEGPVDATRTLGTAVVQFTFTIPDVVTKIAGPTVPEPPDPDTLPGSDWPDVEKVFIDVESEPLVEEAP